MSRQVDIKALVSHVVRGDGINKCRICMGDTSEGQVFLGDTVLMDGEQPVTLSELLETITGVQVSKFIICQSNCVLRKTERRLYFCQIKMAADGGLLL